MQTENKYPYIVAYCLLTMRNPAAQLRLASDLGAPRDTVEINPETYETRSLKRLSPADASKVLAIVGILTQRGEKTHASSTAIA